MFLKVDRSIAWIIASYYNINTSRRRDVPNGEIPKANLLFCLVLL